LPISGTSVFSRKIIYARGTVRQTISTKGNMTVK
jgi:hypothetical protein